MMIIMSPTLESPMIIKVVYKWKGRGPPERLRPAGKAGCKQDSGPKKDPVRVCTFRCMPSTVRSMFEALMGSGSCSETEESRDQVCSINMGDLRITTCMLTSSLETTVDLDQTYRTIQLQRPGPISIKVPGHPPKALEGEKPWDGKLFSTQGTVIIELQDQKRITGHALNCYS